MLEASSQAPNSVSAVKRLVGGGFFDNLKSIAGKVGHVVSPLAPVIAPLAKQKLATMGTKGAIANAGLEALGMGKKGGLQNRIQ